MSLENTACGHLSDIIEGKIAKGNLKLKNMTLIEGLYYIGYSIKKRRVLKHQKRLPCKVISIGNITVGGTGKTPATIAVAEEARKRGLIPGILTRGYRGKMKGPCFVSKGDRTLLDEEEAGDEPVLMAEKLKGMPVIKGADRYEAGIFALKSLPSTCRPDVFVLDDGYQHWKLFRDKDILLIDGINHFGNGKLLPLGPLREPREAISRADIIVITKTVETRKSEGALNPVSKGEGGSLLEEIRRYNPGAPLFLAEHKPARFVTASGETFPLQWAKDKRFFSFCGIGSPESFKETLFRAGLDLGGFTPYSDHYRYNTADMKKIMENSRRANADWIVTTEKDIMRLRKLDLPENLVSLAIEFTVGERFYEEVFVKLENSKR
jgi:tetraacyldisaccharide 4'-kinase